MSFLSDLKVLYHLTMKPVRGKDHASRMESFYGGQAEAYDNFRKRLLKGREELWQLLEVPDDGIWADMGGGTGSNLENIGEDMGRLKKAYVVDLATSLLGVASERFQARALGRTPKRSRPTPPPGDPPRVPRMSSPFPTR